MTTIEGLLEAMFSVGSAQGYIMRTPAELQATVSSSVVSWKSAYEENTRKVV
jgi:hypothetical protein